MGAEPFDKSAQIVIQWSQEDRAWIAAVHSAGPLAISRVMADGASPSKAFRALDEVIGIMGDAL